MLGRQSLYRRDLSHTQLDHLNPILRAYALGYLTSTLPRFPSTFKLILRSNLSTDEKLKALQRTLTTSVGWNRFSTSCAIIISGSTILPDLCRKLLMRLYHALSSSALRHSLCFLIDHATLFCSFGTAWLAFSLLNRDKDWARKRASSMATRMQMQPAWESSDLSRPRMLDHKLVYAGKTIDFTLFAACRALDVLVISAWLNTRTLRLHPENITLPLSHLLQKLADPLVFSISSTVIMWSWFFAPERLPKTYNQWISRVAQIDHRLIHALRLARQGDLVYGSAESQNADLPSLCKELKLPLEWGDPAITVPIPCELYHCGTGKSCEIHAGTRFLRTFTSAIRIYFPLQLLSLLRSPSLTTKRITSLLTSTARSSAFLAAFVSLFYYAVCLARTRLGPRLFSVVKVTPQMWDSGLCVLAGCLTCGWSILLEKSGRRQEIAFFVAPRALATLLPRVYDNRYQRREQILFAASVAVVMDAVRKKKGRVRGVFGRVLEQVSS